MKTLFMAAALVVAGAGTSFAQGLPAGTTPPVYGVHAFPDAQYHDQTIFSELFGGSRASQTKTGRNAEPVAKTDKNG